MRNGDILKLRESYSAPSHLLKLLSFLNMPDFWWKTFFGHCFVVIARPDDPFGRVVGVG